RSACDLCHREQRVPATTTRRYQAERGGPGGPLVRRERSLPPDVWEVHAELTRGSTIIALTMSNRELRARRKLRRSWTLQDRQEQPEFVMEDSGDAVLAQPRHLAGPRQAWFFGQFESPVLDCVLLLLCPAPSWPGRSGPDPVKVARALSAVINSSTRAACWSATGLGTTRTAGAPRIFREFHTNKRPVMFGQCWVFSGCLDFGGRALGIPTVALRISRPRTTPTPTCLIDKFYHSTGEPFRTKTATHLELPCVERDVDDAAEPRQALQRLAGCGRHTAGMSGGFFQTGPCPLLAIREGEVNVPHDANFIFSEVNACVKRYVSPDNGETWIEAHSDPESVGKFLSTKRQDLTNLYKYEEGSSEEQATFERARELARQAGNERLPPPRVSPDGQEAPVWRLRILPGPDAASSGIVFGQDASVEVADRAGSCYCSAVLRNSAGKDLKELSVENVKLDLPANVETTAKLSINAWQYTEFGNEEVDIVIQASLTDTENRVQTLDHVIGILYPDLLIRIPSQSIKKYRTSEIVVELKNDLEFALTDAKFSIEAPGLRSYDLEQKVDDIEPGAEAAATFKVRFYRAGPITLVASFSSKQVTGVFQQASFYVDYY
uniref:C2 domain-containing protein n=1 Tax=Macrostomum lignano TaxID=282301 RepID=A0A1I8FMW3_9PLAT